MSTYAWLHDLFVDTPGLVSVVSDRNWAGERFPTTELDRAASWLERVNQSANVYVACGTLAVSPVRGRGGAGDVVAIPGMWSDLDIAGRHHRPPASGRPHPPDEAAARAVIDAVGLPPSAVIHSGHGLYAWWLFAEPWLLNDPDEHRAARNLAERFGATLVEHGRRRGWHVDHVGDLARVLRPPGTVNRKGEPVTVELVEIADRRFLPSDIADVLIDLPSASAPKRRPRDPILFESPIDAFNRLMPWGRILDPHGWRYTHTVDGTDHWARAGKRGAKITSATTGFGAGDADLLYVWSDDVEVRPLPTRKWLSKFQAYSTLSHGGDQRAAFRAIVDAARARRAR